MSLLQEIQAAATDDAVPLSAVLRKCQILATKLHYPPFKQWVDRESNGYPAGAELPEYRVMRGVPSKANFVGVAGLVSNYPVPHNVVPHEDLQNLIATMTMRDGVAEYEAMLQEAKGHPGGAIKSVWPGDTINILRMEGMRCIEAWQELPMSAVAGMLSQIRNRLLAFTLEIEEANPELGDRMPTPTEKTQVAATYQTVIMGGQQTFVHGGAVEQHITIEAGDLAGLILTLRDLGVPQEELSALTRAIETDKEVGAGFGQQTERWVRSAGKKAASGAWQVALATAPTLIEAAVKGYCGIH